MRYRCPCVSKVLVTAFLSGRGSISGFLKQVRTCTAPGRVASKCKKEAYLQFVNFVICLYSDLLAITNVGCQSRQVVLEEVVFCF